MRLLEANPGWSSWMPWEIHEALEMHGPARILYLCFAQNQWEMFAQAPREGGGLA